MIDEMMMWKNVEDEEGDVMVEVWMRCQLGNEAEGGA